MSIVGGAASGAAMGFAFGGPWGAIAGGAIGGITSMFSESAAAKEMNENLKRAKEMAFSAMISQDEIADRLHSIDRQFNSRLTSVLNTTAIRSRGIANRGVVGAAVAGSVEGARLATEAGVVADAQKTNTGLTMAIAQMEMSRQNPDMIGAFVEGAAAGATTGMEVEKMIGGRVMPQTDPGVQDGGQAKVAGFGSIPAMQDAGKFNPFLTDQSRRAGNLTDPFGRIPTQSPFIGNVTGGFNG